MTKQATADVSGDDTTSRVELDTDGMVTNRPVLGWTHGPVAGIAVLLRLNYAETLADQAAGGRHLQVMLTPTQALALAEDMTRTARLVLGRPPADANH